MIERVVALLLLSCSVVVAGQSQGRSISGRVVINDKAESLSPVRRSVVVLSGEAIKGTRSTMTDDSGAFQFPGLPTGRYSLSASKPAFVPGRYGAPAGSATPGMPVVLTAAADVKDLTITLAPGAVIAGTVFDYDGLPMYGARVSLARAPSSGPLVSAPLKTMVTNDLGEYRFFGLPAGRYVVSAINSQTDLDGALEIPASWFDVLKSRPGAAPSAESTTPARAMGYAATFASGTADVNAAEIVTVRLGEERLGVRVPMVRVRTADVSGSVVSPNGVAAKGLVLTLRSDAEKLGLRSFAVSTRITVRPDGRFVRASLPPGRYRLEARAQGPDGAALWADASFDLNGADVTGMALTLAPGVRVEGRVAGAGSVRPESAQLRIKMTSLDPIAKAEVLADVGPSGAFVAEGAVPGEYSVSLVEASAGPWRVQMVKTGEGVGTRGDDLSVRIPAEPLQSPLTVVVTNSPPVVRGTLSDGAGAPVSEFTVVLFSKDSRHWVPRSTRIRSGRPDAGGVFEFLNVLPGEYFVGVLVGISGDELDDPAFLESLSTASSSVSVVDGGTARIALRVG